MICFTQELLDWLPEAFTMSTCITGRWSSSKYICSLSSHIGCLLLVLSSTWYCSLVINLVVEMGIIAALMWSNFWLVVILLSLPGIPFGLLVYLIKTPDLLFNRLNLFQDLQIPPVHLLIAQILDDPFVDIYSFAFGVYLTELIDVIDKPVSIRVTRTAGPPRTYSNLSSSLVSQG